MSSQSKMNNVLNAVVANDLCIGCGVCASICAQGTLKMGWSDKGELIPFDGGKCVLECARCLSVCPFYMQENDKNCIASEYYEKDGNIKNLGNVGYYLDCYVGYSNINDERIKGASGGMATSVLRSMLEKNIVDRVVCVLPDKNSNDKKLFRFGILNNSTQLKESAGSKYYPVEISDVMRHIMDEKDDLRYAVIGLPCLIYAVRLSMKSSPIVKKRISFCLSLVCGKLPNRFYTELLSLHSGIAPDTVNSVEYRIKVGSRRASNYGFQASTSDGKKGMVIDWTSLPSHLWLNSYFVHNACNFCDDVFGETADATFMDAWLPEYETDPKGNSLILVRDHRIIELLEGEVLSGNCSIEKIPVEKIIQSQAGVIKNKQHLIRGRIYKASKKRKCLPKTSFQKSAYLYFRNAFMFNIKSQVMVYSKSIWPVHSSDPDTKRYFNKMKKFETGLNIVYFMENVLASLKRYCSFK